MDDLLIAILAFAGLNLLLAVVVGVVYVRNHRELRSPFTRGMALFALFLVVHNALQIYHLATMMESFTPQAEWFLLAEGGLQTVALASLGYAVMR
jgi:hypothetical protein